MGGSGSTTTTGIIPPELRGLYRSSANALVGQQEQNPLGQYNAENPLQVAGSDPMQQYGASLIGGGAQPTGVDALTLQSILRSTGLAGAGPTTGNYDYGSEAGLGDIMSFLQPYQLTAPGIENSPRALGSAGFANADPLSTPPPNDYSGVGAALAQQNAPTNNGGQATTSGGQPIPGTVAPRSGTSGGPSLSDFLGGSASAGNGVDWRNDPRLNFMAQGNQITPGSWRGGYDANGQPLLPHANLIGGPADNVGVAGTHAYSGAQLKPSGLSQQEYSQVLNEANRATQAATHGMAPNSTMDQIRADTFARRQAAPKPGQAGYANDPASWANRNRS